MVNAPVPGFSFISSAERLVIRDTSGNPQSIPTRHSGPVYVVQETAPARQLRALLELEEPLLLVGDYNVIPEPADANISIID